MFRFTSPADGDMTGSLASMTGEGNEIINVGINVRALPEDIQSVCQDLVEKGDGVLDMDEFRKMVSTYAVLRKANDEGSVSIDHLFTLLNPCSPPPSSREQSPADAPAPPRTSVDAPAP